MEFTLMIIPLGIPNVYPYSWSRLAQDPAIEINRFVVALQVGVSS